MFKKGINALLQREKKPTAIKLKGMEVPVVSV